MGRGISAISSRKRTPPSAWLMLAAEVLERPREGSLAVAEQLALDEGVRDGRAVDADEGHAELDCSSAAPA